MGLQEQRDTAVAVAVVLGLVLLGLAVWGMCVRAGGGGGGRCGWYDALAARRPAVRLMKTEATIDRSEVPFLELAPAFTNSVAYLAQAGTSSDVEFLMLGPEHVAGFRVKGMQPWDVYPSFQKAAPYIKEVFMMPPTAAFVLNDPRSGGGGGYEIDGVQYSYSDLQLRVFPQGTASTVSDGLMVLLHRGTNSFIMFASQLAKGDYARMNALLCGTLDSKDGAALLPKDCQGTGGSDGAPAWRV